MKGNEYQCNKCKEYFGLIQMRRSDGASVARPWCNKWNEFCQPQKHECETKGVVK